MTWQHSQNLLKIPLEPLHSPKTHTLEHSQSQKIAIAVKHLRITYRVKSNTCIHRILVNKHTYIQVPHTCSSHVHAHLKHSWMDAMRVADGKRVRHTSQVWSKSHIKF